MIYSTHSRLLFISVVHRYLPTLTSIVFFHLLDIPSTVTMRCAIVGTLLSAVTAVYGYADPMACSGVCNNAHDPALIRRADGTYYRFSTSGKIAIHSAPSITGPWTYKGAAIPAGSKINLAGKNDLWVCKP